MKGIHLKALRNVFANIVRKLRVFSHVLYVDELFPTYSPLNASGYSIVTSAPGGPERSAGSLGVAVCKRVWAAYSNLELNPRILVILRCCSDWANRIIKDKQCLETSVRLTMTRS